VATKKYKGIDEHSRAVFVIFLTTKRNKKEVLVMDRMKAKAIRCYFGESFEKFAQRVGVGVATIHAIEKGERDITDYVRAKLVRVELELPDDFYPFYTLFRMNA
jgi:DNA-binding XRE family transcriptional regulator